MTCGVEHDPKAARIAIHRLMRGLPTSALDDDVDRGLEVIHQDLQVHHLRSMPGLLRPRRRLVRGFCLDVEAHPAVGVAELKPTGIIAGGDLPAEQLGIERSKRLGL